VADVVVVNIAASITLYMVSHLPTVESHGPGHAGSPGTTARIFPGGIPGKLPVTIREAIPAVKGRLGKMRKLRRAGARKAGTERTGHDTGAALRMSA